MLNMGCGSFDKSNSCVRSVLIAFLSLSASIHERVFEIEVGAGGGKKKVKKDE